MRRQRVLLLALLPLGAIVLAGAALLAIGRIPFVEGDRVITRGDAYGFAIGMSRTDALRALRHRYAKPGNELRVVWEKSTPLDEQLASYENTELAAYEGREHGEHRVSVIQLDHLTAPFATCNEWRLEMPAEWVNDIYLTFQDQRLVRIERSRWLFERP